MLKASITALIFGFLFSAYSFGQQESIKIKGVVKDTANKPVPFVNVSLKDTPLGTATNDSGYFSIPVPAGKEVTLIFTSMGFVTEKRTIMVTDKEIKPLNIVFKVDTKVLDEIQVKGTDRSGGLEKLNIRDYNYIPNPSGNIETLVKVMGGGVSARNELSSQYSVRGGNFDENLVYVNDVEIMRPFLMRSGQQEGLSFANSQMVSSLRFSSGGFETRYGDKMSSVLDITYRQPEKFAVNTMMSLLGGSITCEGITKNKKWYQISGVRYKTSKYLLNTFETSGEYNPSFVDIQSYTGFRPSSKLDFSFLGNLSQNIYDFVPQTRNTNFGTSDYMLNLKVYYDGRELDKYLSATGAFTTAYKPQNNLLLKLILSGYTDAERETFDISGEYLINELDNSPSSSSYKDSVLNIGIGGMLEHARNLLWVDAFNINHLGIFEKDNHTIRWSVQAKHEWVSDRLNEWSMFDSAGFAKPFYPDRIVVNGYVNGENTTQSTRYSGYVQDTWRLTTSNAIFYLNGGVRYHYWTFNKELLVSPRLRISYQPANNKNLMFYFATGLYAQPPVYREMRDKQGVINKNIKSQKSLHFVVGNDYYLQLWDRPFKLTTEIYYKKLTDINPYKLDNLRITYRADNSAVGYAAGMDLRLNGEFVPGLESWFTLSVMKTEEDIKGDSYVDENGVTQYPGYYGRPTDQRIMMNLFFQDYLPNNPTMHVHLNLFYGSAVPVTPPRAKRSDMTFPMGPYRRVDLGISKTLVNWENKLLKEFSVGLEIFNLLNILNKSSYLWVRTVNNQDSKAYEYAIPNYLTSRRLNFKISAKF
jgi:hypothetical protein